MRTYAEAALRQRATTLGRIAVGWICLGLGLSGLVLPLLPGVPLLFAGLFLLSGNYRWARESLLWLKARLRRITSPEGPSPNTISYPRRVQR
jgi:hypothetical protein